MASKNAAAVVLGRKGGRKGGPARAAKLTPEQRSESARQAVLARWAKTKVKRKDVLSATKKLGRRQAIRKIAPAASIDTSDTALTALLKRLKSAVDLAEVRQLSDQIERVIFHKQFTNA